jgi:CDP-diacylglycerol--glycerol-3-phosphate 3-phosphatidyltransferase
MKTADAFTLVRIIYAPIFFLLYFIPEWTGFGASLSIYILIPTLLFAEFTDFLDGYYARKHNVVSDFGKIFDPFADVLLHLTTFYCYVLSGYMPTFLFLLILFREFGMLFIRQMASKKGVAIGARKGGKFKTVLYVVTGMFSLFIESTIRLGLNGINIEVCQYIGIGLYVLCVVASYASFIDYLVHFGGLLKDN